MGKASYGVTHKYNRQAGVLKGLHQADAALVLVLGGRQGTGYGFAGQPAFTRSLPEVLRFIAQQIEADLEDKRPIRPDRAKIYPTDGSEIRDLSPQHLVVPDVEFTRQPGESVHDHHLRLKAIDLLLRK